MNILDKFTEDQNISPMSDPFKKECITKVLIHIYKDHKNNFLHSGFVEFTNGDTEGKQNFKADDFLSLVKKMEVFVKIL